MCAKVEGGNPSRWTKTLLIRCTCALEVYVRWRSTHLLEGNYRMNFSNINRASSSRTLFFYRDAGRIACIIFVAQPYQLWYSRKYDDQETNCACTIKT